MQSLMGFIFVQGPVELEIDRRRPRPTIWGRRQKRRRRTFFSPGVLVRNRADRSRNEPTQNRQSDCSFGVSLGDGVQPDKVVRRPARPLKASQSEPLSRRECRTGSDLNERGGLNLDGFLPSKQSALHFDR
jgi:hypothetical protein